ncbi:MAG TPA: hypothetical protein VH619_00635 [Verrucomicrobiae bacterium]|nr:hypothetical protein [Verrucomicrobiae bacterium]
MKLRCHRNRKSAGYFLIELLVYMALLVVIWELAYAAYWRCLDNSKRLQLNAAEILQAVEAGERWRGDVRLSRSASIHGNLFTLVQPGDTVEYRFDKESVMRRSTRSNRTVCLLNNVRFSGMNADPRRQVRGWKWELEMQSSKKPPFLRPLFTFEAVPNQ